MGGNCILGKGYVASTSNCHISEEGCKSRLMVKMGRTPNTSPRKENAQMSNISPPSNRKASKKRKMHPTKGQNNVNATVPLSGSHNNQINVVGGQDELRKLLKDTNSL